MIFYFIYSGGVPVDRNFHACPSSIVEIAETHTHTHIHIHACTHTHRHKPRGMERNFFSLSCIYLLLSFSSSDSVKRAGNQLMASVQSFIALLQLTPLGILRKIPRERQSKKKEKLLGSIFSEQLAYLELLIEIQFTFLFNSVAFKAHLFLIQIRSPAAASSSKLFLLAIVTTIIMITIRCVAHFLLTIRENVWKKNLEKFNIFRRHLGSHFNSRNNS